jgi:hypothetical protein
VLPASRGVLNTKPLVYVTGGAAHLAAFTITAAVTARAPTIGFLLHESTSGRTPGITMAPAEI